MMRRNILRFIERDFAEATPVGLILRDLGMIHEEALNAILLGGLTQQIFVEAVGNGIGNDDMAALVCLCGEASGITLTDHLKES